jgi:hypothetical protein
MRNKLFILVAIAFVAGTMLAGCNSPENKAETTQEKIRDAQQNVAEANLALAAAIEQFKIESAEALTENEESIAQFKLKIADESAENKATSEEKLAELEQKNKELKEKLANYKAEGNEQWETFKAEFIRDMDEMGKVFNDSLVSKIN